MESKMRDHFIIIQYLNANTATQTRATAKDDAELDCKYGTRREIRKAAVQGASTEEKRRLPEIAPAKSGGNMGPVEDARCSSRVAYSQN